MPHSPDTSSGPTETSESDFLAVQAEAAKVAAFAALNQAKVALEKNVDPRPAMRQHPLIAIGVATVAGFVAALMTVPSKEEQELQRLERMHRAMNPGPAAPAASNGDAKTNGHAPPHSSIWSSIIHEIVQLIRPILLTAITTGIKSATNPPPNDPPDQNPNRPF